METKKTIVNVSKLVFNLALIIFLIEYLGKWGALTYISGVFIWTLVIYMRQREQFNIYFIDLCRRIEIAVFGKPFEKEYWKNGQKPSIKKNK